MGERYVLSDTMWVELDGIYGSDSDIVRRARVSTATKKKVFRADGEFIKYLWEHGHTSPFGFSQITVQVGADKATFEQWFRHRVGVVGNFESSDTDFNTHAFHEQQQFSGRYAQYESKYYLPDVSRLTKQSIGNNQGSSSEVVENAEQIHNQMREDQELLEKHYNEYLEAGLAREIARINQPFSQVVTFYFQMNLIGWFHWLQLRRDEHSQYEIRKLAGCIENIIKEAFPLSYAAWDEVVSGLQFTRSELIEILPHLDGGSFSKRLVDKIQSRKEKVT